MDALADPDFALKVRERHQENLDSALRMALQLEVWTKDRARLRGEKTQERNEIKRTREVTKTEAAPTVRENEALKKEAADQKRKIAELEAQMAKSSIRDQQDEAKTAETDKRPRPLACWGCGELGHSLKTCSKRTIRLRGNEALKKEVADQKRKIVELEAQMKKNSIRDQPDEVETAEADKRPRPLACWGCGELGHTLRICPKRTMQGRRQFWEASNSKEATKDVRPIREKQVRTCILVKFKHHRLNALVDTGSDITIAGNNFARKYDWKIDPHPMKTVKIANGECMIIYGVARVTLKVGDRSVESEILISPDLNGLIIGIDWLEKQGEFVWDFRNQRIRFEDGGWMELQKEDEEDHVRRLYVSEDTLLLPTQQTEVPARVSHRTRKDKACVGMIESGEVSSMRHVYNARSLIPARFSDIKVSVLNAEDRTQVITKGTELGILHEAEVIDEAIEDAQESRPEDALSPPEAVAIEKMIKQLPDEVTEEQLKKVHRIVTGGHRPIRQALRQHPFPAS